MWESLHNNANWQLNIYIPEIYKFICKVTNCWLYCSRHWRWLILQPERNKSGWFCHLIRIPENTHWMFWWQIPTIACVTLSKSIGLIIFSGKSTATLNCVLALHQLVLTYLSLNSERQDTRLKSGWVRWQAFILEVIDWSSQCLWWSSDI